ncbi:MAG: GlcG/HbpS family heme-binding protein [Desulfobulbia bacterium]
MKALVPSMLAAASGFVLTMVVANAADESFVSFRVLKPELALQAAQAAMADCRQKGFQVTVSVTDRFGGLQVTLRDQLAGPHTPDTAYRKAWTAVTFRAETSEVAAQTGSGALSGIRNVEGVLPVGGGVRIIAGEGDMVGAIGVSGAPSRSEDEACAKAGINAIAAEIEF